MTCINRQRALLAGHDNEHEDSILDLMEVYGADGYEGVEAGTVL